MLQIGGWPAPFGITLVADLLAALLVVAVGIVGVAITGAAFAGVDPRREAFGYHPLIHILLMGVVGRVPDRRLLQPLRVVRGDAGRLVRADGAAPHARAAGGGVQVRHDQPDRIVDLSRPPSGCCTAWPARSTWPTWRASGRRSRTPGLDIVLAVLFLIAFSIKAGLFPLFFWLPASYHTPPAADRRRLRRPADEGRRLRADSDLHAAVPERAAGALHAAPGDVGATMVIGLIAALTERDFRRILSFNLVGHIGYTTASLAC